eukprot:TRINITY_DN2512_c0_g1_i1.p1 TRINITY_DN2512_c0_g1~~TRINITY_DN2512_c0_g1_i1.p1  ORF type:complete len:247 (-),score=55.11 TRINITY_DN2512_c0_g1_i1:514-1254(-)
MLTVTVPDLSLWAGALGALVVADAAVFTMCVPVYGAYRWAMSNKKSGARWWLFTCLALTSDLVMFMLPWVINAPFGLPRYILAFFTAISCWRILEVVFETAPLHHTKDFTSFACFVILPMEHKTPLKTRWEAVEVCFGHIVSALWRLAVHIAMISVLVQWRSRHCLAGLCAPPPERIPEWATPLLQCMEYTWTSTAFLIYLASSFEFLHSLGALVTQTDPMVHTRVFSARKTKTLPLVHSPSRTTF